MAGPVVKASLSILEKGSHCVAYRTDKRLMLLRKTRVVGKNCSVSSQVIPELGGKYYIEVVIPIRNFRSGESKRDQDVIKILKAETQSDIVFRSKEMTVEQWQELIAKEQFHLKGRLNIAKKKFPMTAKVRVTKGDQGWEVDGIYVGKFSDFGLEPPKLAAGLMAKVSDKLELHFRLLGRKTLGVDTILPSEPSHP